MLQPTSQLTSDSQGHPQRAFYLAMFLLTLPGLVLGLLVIAYWFPVKPILILVAPMLAISFWWGSLFAPVTIVLALVALMKARKYRGSLIYRNARMYVWLIITVSVAFHFVRAGRDICGYAGC